MDCDGIPVLGVYCCMRLLFDLFRSNEYSFCASLVF